MDTSKDVPSTSVLTDTDGVNTDDFVGFAMDNVIIHNALIARSFLAYDDDDAPVVDYPDATDGVEYFLDQMDTCLHSFDEGFIQRHTVSGCLTTASTSEAPDLCKDQDYDQCRKQPVTFGTDQYSASDYAYEKPVGLAKDGHIIVGPYNSDGELWSCSEHDICNGVFLDDQSYAYVTTYTFPYVVGCFGPGPQQSFSVNTDDSTCSTRSCEFDAALSGMQLGLSTLLATVVALTQI